MNVSIVIVSVFLASVLTVALVRKLAHRYEWVARPRGDRWHAKATALHGGVGFFPAFVFGSAVVYAFLAHKMPQAYGGNDIALIFAGCMAGAAIMFFTGLIDDIYHLKPAAKLLFEVVATVIFIYCGGIAHVTGFLVVDVAITFLWFIGIVNAVNLLDNMDGVSSGVVIIGALGVCVVGYLGHGEQLPLSVWIGLVLFASTLGFWVFNRPPASIFMGDSGSLFMGFVFAAITLPTPINHHYGMYRDGWLGIQPLLLAMTLAAIPILDTTFVTITRLWRGQSPAKGGRDHSTHRLAHSGLTAVQTIVVLYSLAALCVLMAIIMQQVPQASAFVFCILFLGFGFTAYYLAYVAVDVEENRVQAWRQLLNSVLYRVPLIKVVIDLQLVVLCFYGAYMLRFDFNITEEHVDPLYYGMLIAVISCLIANMVLGVYKFSWRSATGADVVHYVLCAALGTAITVAAIAFVSRFEVGHSRGALVIFSLLYLAALIGSRFSFRLIDEVIHKLRAVQRKDDKRFVVVYGMGRAGRLLHGEARYLPEFSNFRIIGFVDDSPSVSQGTFAGLPIVMPRDIKRLDLGDGIPEIWISSQKIPDERAIELKRQLERNAIIRRLRITMDEVES